MKSSKNWKKIKSWNVGASDGSIEKYSLYEEESSGCIRIQNDFGNITIDMERMSGYEFLKRAYQEVENLIPRSSSESDDDWMYSIDFGDDDSYDNNNCDHTD